MIDSGRSARQSGDVFESYPRQCCACGRRVRSRNIITLHRKAPQPGKGWGCVQCKLPSDGAVAAICDACLEANTPIQYAFDGYVLEGKLVPFSELPDAPHEHNMKLHPEVVPADAEG